MNNMLGSIIFIWLSSLCMISTCAIQINMRTLHQHNDCKSMRYYSRKQYPASHRVQRISQHGNRDGCTMTTKNRRRGIIGYASASPLFNDQSSSSNDVIDKFSSTNNASSKQLMPYIAPWARSALLLGVGYCLGSFCAPGWQRQSRVMTKVGVTRIALTLFILRDAWRCTPQWAKPRIAKYGKKVMNVLNMPFRKIMRSGVVEDELDETDDDLDDITSLSNFATKVQTLMNVAKRKLEIGEDEQFNVQASVLALLQLTEQIKFRRPSSRDEIYRTSGTTTVPDEMLDGMDELFELADLAYDEHKDGPLENVLKTMGFNLIKHDKTAVPGYLGHYIAINADNTKEKTAIIGVKGTSNFEDFFTDLCASAVQYNLTNPFYEGGNNSLTCHEGVWISSQRLFDTLLPTIKDLLLPSGYKIVIVGHSLGAGAATLLSILLRSAIPSLQQDSDKLKVWAFASPPILDLTSARACSSFVTTVVNNADAVPRGNISPVVITTRVLRAVNKRLKEKNLDLSSFQSTMAFLNKIYEGTDGEMLMSADEIISELESALDGAELQDPDHLYVPGKVVLMYHLWMKEQQIQQQKQKDGKENLKDYFSSTIKDFIQRVEGNEMHSSAENTNLAAEEAILCDGTCKALRFIELDGRLLDDHMAPSYRASIANILSSRNKTITFQEKQSETR